MIIKSLDLSNFRNYKELHLVLDQGINIFYGDNAQGKTNILESIYLGSTNKSHRGSKDKEMISFGEEEAHLKMIADKKHMEYRIDMHLKNNKSKGIAVNSVPVRKSGDFLGIINTVFFSPEDLQLIKMGPSERRRFIDLELCQLDKIYLSNYVRYRKNLEHRNQLLKDIAFRPDLLETLSVWDEQLAEWGGEIIKRRESFIKELGEIMKPVHETLSGRKETLEIGYEANVTPELFLEKLKKNREKDLKLKTTSVGPHRDDISFFVNGIDARIYGSQGQQRTCALSLKLSEIQLVKKKTGENPVLLLDDVLSELDSSRQTYLLDSIQDIQTLITCTGLEEFVGNRFPVNKIFKVENGTVISEN